MTAEVFCLCEIYHSVIADNIIPYIRYRSIKQHYSDKWYMLFLFVDIIPIRWYNMKEWRDDLCTLQ